MKCSVCHAQMEQRQGEIELRIYEKLFLVDNVTYQECPTCGERILSPEISQDIFNKITRKEYKEKHMVVPVVEGKNAESV